jgi:hypothetical protein
VKRRLFRGFEGPRTGHTVELGRGPSVYWASQESGEDLSAVGELEILYGVQVQSDDGVVIIGGFFLSLGSPSSSPSFSSDRAKTGRLLALVWCDCRV